MIMGKGFACQTGEVKAYLLENAAYGAGANQCSEFCAAPMGLAWIAGHVKGSCADAGYTENVEQKSVQPQGSPMPMNVMIMGKGFACQTGEVKAYLLENAAYGAGADQCSEFCAAPMGLAWIAGHVKGSCADAGYTEKVEQKSV